MANTRELKPEVRKVYQTMLESYTMDTDNGDESHDKSELSDIKKNHADECSHSSD